MEIPVHNDNTQQRRRKMREEDIPLGGGNIWAILISGILMFLFYTFGWGYMGTFALFVFLVVGFQSLFPIIAAFLGLLILCVYHFQEPAAYFAIIFWIVLMTMMEIVARTGGFDEKEVDKNTPDKNCHS